MKRKEFFGLVGKGLVGGAAFLSGCSDLLTQDNPNSLTPDSFWLNPNDANANIASIYEVFLGRNGGRCVDNWWNRLVPGMYRGDDVGITHDVAAFWDIALFNVTDTNDRVNGAWFQNYQGVFRANQAIENIAKIDSIDSGDQARLIGEAKFLRAFFNFQLVIKFNRIPIITTVPQSNSEYSVSQSPPEATWAQIEKDLTDAIAALPSTYDDANLGRATKGAAMGYLGKSQLFQQKWQEAADTFEQIIGSNTYQLMPEFGDIFLDENEFSEESLLEVNYSLGSFKGETEATPQNYEEAPSEAGGYYEYYPNQWLFDEMSKETTTGGDLDPRLYATIIFPGSGMVYFGSSYDELFGAGATKLSWAKYSEWELGHPVQEQSGKNERILRYADILLMYAEALNNLDQTPDAIGYVNQVRNRADLGDLPLTTTKAELMTEIEHQRVVELADETNRFYDLLRWGGSIDQSMSIKENLTAHGAIGAANYVEGKHEYLPIPLSELQTNTKIEQNPGY